MLYDRFATPGLAVVWIGHVGRAVSPTHARREVLILFEAFVLRVGAAASVAAIVTRLGAILLLTLPLTSHCCGLLVYNLAAPRRAVMDVLHVWRAFVPMLTRRKIIVLGEALHIWIVATARLPAIIPGLGACLPILLWLYNLTGPALVGRRVLPIDTRRTPVLTRGPELVLPVALESRLGATASVGAVLPIGGAAPLARALAGVRLEQFALPRSMGRIGGIDPAWCATILASGEIRGLRIALLPLFFATFRLRAIISWPRTRQLVWAIEYGRPRSPARSLRGARPRQLVCATSLLGFLTGLAVCDGPAAGERHRASHTGSDEGP